MIPFKSIEMLSWHHAPQDVVKPNANLSEDGEEVYKHNDIYPYTKERFDTIVADLMAVGLTVVIIQVEERVLIGYTQYKSLGMR